MRTFQEILNASIDAQKESIKNTRNKPENLQLLYQDDHSGLPRPLTWIAKVFMSKSLYYGTSNCPQYNNVIFWYNWEEIFGNITNTIPFFYPKIVDPTVNFLVEDRFPQTYTLDLTDLPDVGGPIPGGFYALNMAEFDYLPGGSIGRVPPEGTIDGYQPNDNTPVLMSAGWFKDKHLCETEPRARRLIPFFNLYRTPPHLPCLDFPMP